MEKLSDDRTKKFFSHKLVNQPKDLTDRSEFSIYCVFCACLSRSDTIFKVWSNIQPTLVEFLSAEREKRLVIERNDALRDRYKLLNEVYEQHLASEAIDLIAPPIADIARSDPFRALINDTPFNVPLPAEEFTALAKLHLPTLITDWRTAKDAELVAILQPHIPHTTARTEHLYLATTVFKCAYDTGRRRYWYSSHECNEPLTYPRVLAHTCTSLHDISGDRLALSSDEPPLDAEMAAFYFLKSMPWNHKYAGDRIAFSTEGAATARAVVEACGLDPAVTTVEDMNKLDPLVKCRTCSDSEKGRLIMRWMWAVCRITSEITHFLTRTILCFSFHVSFSTS